MQAQLLTTNRKALTINLNPSFYGTFAEIGAGQEVARHFFQAGGAAGTVAKSMSAYDMKFSDAIYGKCARYVSRDRLTQMLDHEFALLTERLDATRGDNTRFFVYANTVAAASYKGTKECHGWMGVRYQLNPRQPPSDIILHVRMWDKTAQLQQEALGIIGVNLIYGAFEFPNDLAQFIPSLADNLGVERIEVDILQFFGPDFSAVDNRIVSLELVKHGLTNAVLFGPDGSVLQPSEAFYKKAVLVERGSFRPVSRVNIDMIECAGAQFVQEERNRGEDLTIVMEITINNLIAADNGAVDLPDFLARVDCIGALGYSVLISNYSEFYRLSAYFRRYTSRMLGIVLGINNLIEVFEETYYQNLPGGILEAFGRLFKENTKLYVYPMKGRSFNLYLAQREGRSVPEPDRPPRFDNDFLITAVNVQVKPHLRNLYAHLLENHFIEPVIGYDAARLDTFSRELLRRIQNGDTEAWEPLVPPKVAELIKARGLWGYGKTSAPAASGTIVPQPVPTPPRHPSA